MKIDNVDILPKNTSNVVNLSFKDPRRLSKFNVRGIFGLDAEEIITRFHQAVGQNKFFQPTMGSRTIVVRIELNPDFSQDETYSNLRDHLYKLISSSYTGTVTINFKLGNVIQAFVKGHIEKFEAPLFNEIPEVQLTIKCKEPMLKSPQTIAVPVVGEPTNSLVIVDDISTAAHGFEFSYQIVSARNSVEMIDPTDTSWSFRIDYLFQAGDIIKVSSVTNAKEVVRTRAGVDLPLANRIYSQSIWPTMFPGENRFGFIAPEGLAWLSLSYVPVFWGI